MTDTTILPTTLHDVVAKARALHSPTRANKRASYAQIRRLDDERRAAADARLEALRRREMYEMSGLVFCLPAGSTLNPYSGE